MTKYYINKLKERFLTHLLLTFTLFSLCCIFCKEFKSSNQIAPIETTILLLEWKICNKTMNLGLHIWQNADRWIEAGCHRWGNSYFLLIFPLSFILGATCDRGNRRASQASHWRDCRGVHQNSSSRLQILKPPSKTRQIVVSSKIKDNKVFIIPPSARILQFSSFSQFFELSLSFYHYFYRKYLVWFFPLWNLDSKLCCCFWLFQLIFTVDFLVEFERRIKFLLVKMTLGLTTIGLTVLWVYGGFLYNSPVSRIRE